MVKRFSERIKSVFTVDVRSLSVMRIGIASVLIIDLVIRLSNVEAHYSNKGVLPLEALFQYGWNEYYFSFYTLTGNSFLQTILFLLNMVLAVFLLIGYRTRLMTILCWLFLLSLHNRNPLIHQGGDDLLRMILFWAIFLPWGACFSVDSLKKKSSSFLDHQVTSIAVLAYLLQLSCVYFFSALLKTSSEWTSDYTALYYALSFDQIVLPAGRFIYPYESLLKILTMLVYFLELVVSFLLFIPFYTSRFRLLFFLLISLLHLGIALCLNVGLFPIIGVVSCIGILPYEVFKRNVSCFNYFHISSFRIKNFFQKTFNFYSPGQYDFRGFQYLKFGMVLFFLLYVLNWNLWTIGKPVVIPSAYSKWIGSMLRVDQHWGMFAPAVFKDDGWFVFEGTTKRQKKINILKPDSLIHYKRIASVSGVFAEDRWRKFSENILFVNKHQYRSYYCLYLLKQWNNQHSDDQKLKSLELIYMKESSLPHYKVTPVKKETLCSCGI